MTIKVLLAGKVDDDKLRYPLLCTPKLDGIRCSMVNGTPMSRNMKPIPNEHIRKTLNGLPELDGELMTKGDFNNVMSGVMSADGTPDFMYHVFDTFHKDLHHLPYSERIEHLMWMDEHPNIELVLPIMIYDEKELEILHSRYLEEGYEGTMVRDPNGKYKFGRSTTNEGILLKLKPFDDDEAILVEIIEKMVNNNPLEKDELGRAKRSSHKENLTPDGTSGSVVVDWNGLRFNLGFGPGLDDKFKQELWDERDYNIGQKVKFRYQGVSKDGIPRFGKMLGFRHEDDL